MSKLKNFDPEYASVPDFILKSTRRIWEERGIARIRDYYTSDNIVRTPMGLTRGIDAVIAATNATLHQFPDRRLLGEDVIWIGEDDIGCYYSSHRIVSPMHHRGHGLFGPPTGRRVKARTIADTVLRAGKFCEEWLVRDHGAMIRQLGHDVAEFAARSIADELERGLTPEVFTPECDIPGSYEAPTETSDHALMYADTLGSIWQSDCRVVDTAYNEAVALELPGGFSESGKTAATEFWMSLLSAVPDARFTVDHLIGRDDPGHPLRVAARWNVRGTHDGPGAFGDPSGAPIYIMGISHVDVIDQRIVREWVLIDELAIHRQIRLFKG